MLVAQPVQAAQLSQKINRPSKMQKKNSNKKESKENSNCEREPLQSADGNHARRTSQVFSNMSRAVQHWQCNLDKEIEMNHLDQLSTTL